MLALSELCVSTFGTFLLALSEASYSMIQGQLSVNWSCQHEVVVYVRKIGIFVVRRMLPRVILL